MAISSAGSAGGFDPSRMAAELFKKADTNNDGGVDKTELKSMMANKGPTDDVDSVFAKADQNSDGKIDATENESFLENVGKEMQARAEKSGDTGGTPSPPPAGGQGGGGGGSQAAGATSESSDNKTYDPKDTNKDGTVSYQEEMAYAQKHPEKQEKSQNSSQSKSGSDYVKSAVDDVLAKLESSKKYDSEGNINTNGVQSVFSLFK
jgi:hypothetical protein